MSMSFHRACLLGLSLGTLWAIAPAHGMAPALQARGLHGEVIATETEKGWVIEGAGAAQHLPDSKDLALSGLVTQGDRWFAAGVVLDAVGQPTLAAFEGSGTGVRTLPTPETTGAHLAIPRLTTSRDGLGVLVWLEGSGRETMAVRAASWRGDGWSDTVEVAPADGTQLALSATGLADGSALIAWAWYDGNDDEIVWSRYNGTHWSPRRRAAGDNGVPDITPSVIARPDGAWLVWSRYDGNDYRVNRARLEGGGWSTAEVIGGPGSLFPTLVDTKHAPLLVYATAVPRTWSVMELEPDGKLGRRASVPRTAKHRPVVTQRDAEALGFQWTSKEGARTTTAPWQRSNAVEH